jgi:hypothetical protein
MKYEIATGITKSGEELIEIYTELLTKYPRVAILQDPFHKKVFKPKNPIKILTYKNF